MILPSLSQAMLASVTRGCRGLTDIGVMVEKSGANSLPMNSLVECLEVENLGYAGSEFQAMMFI